MPQQSSPGLGLRAQHTVGPPGHMHSSTPYVDSSAQCIPQMCLLTKGPRRPQGDATKAWCSVFGIHGLLSRGSCSQTLAEGSQPRQLQLQRLWPGTTFLRVSTARSLSSGFSGKYRSLHTTALLVAAPFNMNSISQHWYSSQVV